MKKNKLAFCSPLTILFSGLLYAGIIGASLLLTPVVQTFVLLSTFILILIINCRMFSKKVCDNKDMCDKLHQYQQENDESKMKIMALQLEIAKTNTIDKIQKEKDQIKDELVRTTSYNHHLSGIISGLNHELTPWISGMYILAHRLKETENDVKRADSLKKIEMAATQTIEMLNTLSKSVNKLKNFSVFKSNVKETVACWIQLVLLERSIKDKISQENISIDLESLNFIAEHSPMYLSQVILNLAKNSIDHNGHMLDKLKIKIYGDVAKKCLIYEDNGKGIPPDILKRVFNNFGVTTKTCDSGEIHGFGLYSCLNYCMSMKAIIVAESDPNKSTKFIIKFERIKEDDESGHSSDLYYSLKSKE
jgi:signal transduction histidine kinase